MPEDTPNATVTEPTRKGLAAWGGAARRSGGSLGGLIVLVLILALLSPDFLTAGNLLSVGVQASVTALLAFGMTFVIVSGGIDLSVGSLAGFAGIVTGWCVATAGIPLWLALLVGLAAGALAGLVSGVLITAGRVPPFIATLAMLSVGRGLALVISDGRPISVGGWLGDLGGGQLFGVLPYPVLVLVAAGLITAFVLRRTYSGRAMYAIGGNIEAARLSGIKVNRQQLLVYALSGLFAAAAGILLAARLASAQPEAGTGYELDAIAAVVIGGASLAGGAGTALGTFVGALILAVLRNGLNLLNVSAFWQQVVIGAVIALAVLFDTLRRRRTTRSGPNLLHTPALRRAAAVVTVLIVLAAGWGVYARQHTATDKQQPKIALSLSTLNNPFFVDIRKGASQEAHRRGVALSVTDAGSDAEQQANDIQNAIAKDVNALVVNPVDSDAVVPSVKATNTAQIPVIGLDRAPSGGSVVTTVASDNVAGGRAAARQLSRNVGHGPVAVLAGEPGTSAARERGKGFTTEIRKHSNIRVVASQPANFDRTKALNVTQNIMQSHPTLNGVFAANDEMALGAIKALGPRAGKSVKVVGFDGTPEGLDAVQRGRENADVAQQPERLGKAAIDQALRAAKHKHTEPQQPTNTPIQVVTRKNVNEFQHHR